MVALTPLPPEAIQKIQQAEAAAWAWFREHEPSVGRGSEFPYTERGLLAVIEAMIRLLQAVALRLVDASGTVYLEYYPGALADKTEMGLLAGRVRGRLTQFWQFGFQMHLKALFRQEPHRVDTWNAVSTERERLFDLWEPSIDRAISEAIGRYCPMPDGVGPAPTPPKKKTGPAVDFKWHKAITSALAEVDWRSNPKAGCEALDKAGVNAGTNRYKEEHGTWKNRMAETSTDAVLKAWKESFQIIEEQTRTDSNSVGDPHENI